MADIGWVGDGVVNKSHFFHSKRADAVINSQVIPDQGSVIAVMMVGLIVDEYRVTSARPMHLEQNLIKQMIDESTPALQAMIANKSSRHGHCYLTTIPRKDQPSEHFVTVPPGLMRGKVDLANSPLLQVAAFYLLRSPREESWQWRGVISWET